MIRCLLHVFIAIGDGDVSCGMSVALFNKTYSVLQTV